MTTQRPASATSAVGALPDPAFEPGERVIVLLGSTRARGTLIGMAGSKALVKLDRHAVLEVSESWLKREETR